MKLVIGLGNPGPKYEVTRHNVGFLALDRLVDRWNARGPMNKHEGEVYEATVGGEKVLLLKPQTFMNLSGKSAGPLAKFHKIDPEEIVVLYDEIDLPPFQLRIKKGGGAAGHNGIRSLDQGFGTKEYHRVRIGVGRPSLGPSGEVQMKVHDYVLGRFNQSELNELDPLLDEVGEAVELLLEGKSKEAMNKFNQKRGS